MAEWLYEAGIGENRAALVEDGAIVAARIEYEGGLTVGTVAQARLTDIATGRVTLADGSEALIAQRPSGLTQGGALRVRIVREPIPEPGRAKLAKAVPTDEPVSPGPDLLARIAATGDPVRRCLPHEADHLEAAGWTEVLDEALTGEIAFAGGALRMTPTPAMILFDVDGSGPLEVLAVRAATAIARAIVRHDVTGSIGIDFPTLAGKPARQAVADAIDAALPQPFERTAMNGFGFLQIVRRRERGSLPELLRADPAGAAARATLRRIERIPPPPPSPHIVPDAIRRRLLARPDWLETLAKRTGGRAEWVAAKRKDSDGED